VASRRPEAVIFDIGGVLEHTPRTGWQQRWLAETALTPAEFAALLEPIFQAGSIGTITLEEVELRIAAALELDGDALREFMNDLWTEYVGYLNEPIVRYFTALRPRYRTGILSNSFVGAREREQQLYGFEDMCDEVVYSHEEGLMKPAPAIYQIACDRLGVSPERAVLLDDTQANVDGALAVGMRAIRFLDTDQAIRELDALLAG
jgi:epoxide hydrolase-like predicted phosphatase